MRSLAVGMLLLVLAVVARPGQAQRSDSTRNAAARPAPVADSIHPPISPRRAFLYSLLAPGLAQSILGREKSAALFMLFEGIALSMVRESGADVREAQRTANDSLVVTYGTQGIPQKVPPRFDSTYVRARRTHVEDWLAVLIANHLFSGADAFVAANLWDLPAQLSLRAETGARVSLSASVPW